ncbi:nuclear transport factor 2 family protein [Streptomyces sp. NPDC057445]|uniref:nuclear transport factor 2 family protein n=1 Tax=Streptomyces sp. NPDC057445 TaxID=3346136 RepID=UPI0036C44A35
MTSYAAAPAAPPTPPYLAPAAEPYTEVQQFYAQQVELLDDLRADAFAATFTENGLFSASPVRPVVAGRAAIAAALRAAHSKRFGDGQVRRRHWFNMLQVHEQPDGLLRTRYYMLVWVTRPWNPVPEPGPSCVVEDVLVREDGRLLTRERRITPDHLSF